MLEIWGYMFLLQSSVKRRSQSLGGDPSDPRSPTASDSNELMQAYNRIRGSSECLQVLSNRNLGLIEEVEEDKLRWVVK